MLCISGDIAQEGEGNDSGFKDFNKEFIPCTWGSKLEGAEALTKAVGKWAIEAGIIGRVTVGINTVIN